MKVLFIEEKEEKLQNSQKQSEKSSSGAKLAEKGRKGYFTSKLSMVKSEAPHHDR